MFTDRFIKVPVKMYSEQDVELLGKEEYWDSEEMINPLDISRYYSNIGHNDEEGTTIIFKNGGSVMAYISIDEFEKLLNDHGRGHD